MNNEHYLEQEVQRRIAASQRLHHDEITARDEKIALLTDDLIKLSEAVEKLQDSPFYFGTVVKVQNEPDSYRFQTQDEVVVVDENDGLYGLSGRIISHNPVVSDDGKATVELSTGITVELSIGTITPAQIRLVNKSDGSRVIVNVDGKPWEVRGAPELDLKPGDPVKIHSETKQIVSAGDSDLMIGPIVTIEAITPDGVEINDKGDKKLVLNTLGLEIEEGDRVTVDSGYYVILKKLPQDSRNRYKLGNENTIDWDEIGGLEEAKEQCREAIELPFKNPEIFAFYKKKPASGILLYGPPGCGKAQPLTSSVITPFGPMKMGDVNLNTVVSTPDGGEARVVGVFPQGLKDVYRVFFSDESFADCCAEHLWKVESQNGYKSGILDTAELMNKLKMRDGKRIYSIPMTKPVEFNVPKLSTTQRIISPYLMGILIAEGNFSASVSVTICEKEIFDRVENSLPQNYSLKSKNDPERPCDYYITRDDLSQSATLTDEIRRLNLLGKTSYRKFIPYEYLMTSVKEREELLKGLMDGDGHVSKHGMTISYSTASEDLANGVQFLIQSLGGECPISICEKTYTYKGVKKKGRISFVCRINLLNMKDIFSLSRKKDRIVERSKYLPKRMIDRIEFIGREECQCIMIDHPEHLYLTDNFVVTHNTLIARAIATSLKRTHIKDNNDCDILDTGYIYVKSPEILDKWVGNSEAEIRRLFERGRKHYRDNGYKAILAFDEFDAIAPQRGSRRSSDVADTIVPMFLGEMSGANEEQMRENPIVVVMTNRAEVLDPAIIRDGRFSSHIKIGRPVPETASKILEIHTKDIPFAEENKRVLFAVVCQDIFSKSRLLYRVNNEHDFTFSDCVNGAMIENICERAKMFALQRDIRSGNQSGLTLEDFRNAVQAVYENQRGLNHSFDLYDFSEKLGIQAKDMKIDKCFGAS